MNLPGYEFLSAPLWLINILHVVTLTLHFLAMNFMFGGLVTILLGRVDNRWQNPAVQRYIGLLPTAMAATVTFGVAPLLFSQLVYPKQVYAASITSAWFWLLIIPVAIIAYYFLYGAASEKATADRKKIYLWIAFIAFIYVSFIYSATFSLAENSEAIKAAYAACQAGGVINPEVGSYIFRWLHMILGAITVGGFFFGWLGQDNESAYRAGKTIFVWGMATAAVAGLVYLFTMGDYLLPLMRTPGIWGLTVGVILALASLHFYFKKKFPVGFVMVLLSVIMMVYTRHHVRLIHLAEEYNPADMAYKPDWSIFLVFLVFFLVALGVVWYMLKLFFAPPRTGE